MLCRAWDGIYAARSGPTGLRVVVSVTDHLPDAVVEIAAQIGCRVITLLWSASKLETPDSQDQGYGFHAGRGISPNTSEGAYELGLFKYMGPVQ